MCLIAYKPNEDATFTEEQFDRMIFQNSDGLGLMYRTVDNRIAVIKTMGSDKKKRAIYRKYKDISHYAMHARIRTHGETNMDNCHPYEILNKDKGDPIDLFLMHNGVITHAPNIDVKMSDTWNFIEGVLKPIAKANLDLIWNNKAIQKMLEEFIGYSKLLLMRSDDVESPILILNEQKGSTVEGVWLSNTYSQPVKHHVTNYGYNNNTTGNTITYAGNTNRNPLAIQSIREQVTREHKDYSDVYYGGGTNYAEWWTTNKDKSALEWEEPEEVKNETTETKETPVIIIPVDKLDDVVTVDTAVKMGATHEEILQLLKGMSDADLIATLQYSPEDYVDTIQHFYSSVNLGADELVMQMIDDKTVLDTVNLIRHLDVREIRKAA